MRLSLKINEFERSSRRDGVASVCLLLPVKGSKISRPDDAPSIGKRFRGIFSAAELDRHWNRSCWRTTIDVNQTACSHGERPRGRASGFALRLGEVEIGQRSKDNGRDPYQAQGG